MKLKTLTIAALLVSFAGSAVASELVYRPINPSFGGDPLNGNWLLSQATSQGEGLEGGGAGTPGFSIDFPDFGGITQPDADLIDLPDVPAGPT